MDESTYTLRVTLLRVDPPVTRRLQVPSSLRLDRLHQVLQAAMGWEDSHLHEYIVGSLRDGRRYGPSVPEQSFGFAASARSPESRYTLKQIAPRKRSTFLYWYDFGDDWYHEIAVEDISATAPGEIDLRCLAGQGACPPEDCGGPPGYAHLLDALSDPQHDDHDEMRRWIGGDFDPGAFDIDLANEDLAPLARRWSSAAGRKSGKKRVRPGTPSD